MKHTFAICAYKDSPYLEACIRSLRSQKINDKSLVTNIILCTSTLSDYIQAIADRYDIPVFVHNGNSIGEDWNFAYDSAQTDLVTLAHQDDMYGHGYLDAVLKAANKYNDMSLYTCGSVTVRNNKPISDGKYEIVKRILRMKLSINELNHMRIVKRTAISLGNPIICPSCTYNKALCGDHIFNEDYKFVLDWDLLYRLADQKGRWVYDSKPLMLYRVHEDTATAQCIKDNVRQKEELMMFERLWTKQVAYMIAKLYRSSYKAYDI